MEYFSWAFILRVFKAKNTLKDIIWRTGTFLFYQQGRKLFPVKRNLFFEGDICKRKMKERDNNIV